MSWSTKGIKGVPTPRIVDSSHANAMLDDFEDIAEQENPHMPPEDLEPTRPAHSARECKFVAGTPHDSSAELAFLRALPRTVLRELWQVLMRRREPSLSLIQRIESYGTATHRDQPSATSVSQQYLRLISRTTSNLPSFQPSRGLSPPSSPQIPSSNPNSGFKAPPAK